MCVFFFFFFLDIGKCMLYWETRNPYKKNAFKYVKNRTLIHETQNLNILYLRINETCIFVCSATEDVRQWQLLRMSLHIPSFPFSLHKKPGSISLTTNHSSTSIQSFLSLKSKKTLSSYKLFPSSQHRYIHIQIYI